MLRGGQRLCFSAAIALLVGRHRRGGERIWSCLKRFSIWSRAAMGGRWGRRFARVNVQRLGFEGNTEISGCKKSEDAKK